MLRAVDRYLLITQHPLESHTSLRYSPLLTKSAAAYLFSNYNEEGLPHHDTDQSAMLSKQVGRLEAQVMQHRAQTR